MKKHSIYRKLLLLAGSTVVSLLAAELLVRCFYAPGVKRPRIGIHDGVRTDWVTRDNMVNADDGTSRYLPDSEFQHEYDGPGPGRFEPGHRVTYHINSWGYRDLEHAWEKPPNTFRILLLGDSFTFGEGAQFEHAYPQLLVDRLASKRIDDRDIEIINMAVPGHNTDNQFTRYSSVQERLDPDLVILQWNTNDFSSLKVAVDHVNLIGVRYRRIYADSAEYEWSALLHFAWYTLKTRRISRDLTEVAAGEIRRGSKNFDRILSFYRKVTAVDGRDFVLLIFPELIRFRDYPYAEIVDGLAEFCSAERIPFINLLPALSQHRAHELWAHETDHHPNHRAHAVAAREIILHLEKSILRTPSK